MLNGLSWLIPSVTYHSKYPIQGEEDADIGVGWHVHDRPYSTEVEDGSQSLEQRWLIWLGAVHHNATAES